MIQKFVKQTWLFYPFYIVFLATFIWAKSMANEPRASCCIQCIAVLLVIQVLLCYSPLKVPPVGYYSLVILVFITMYLGRGLGWYKLIEKWDDIVHFLSGIVLVLFGFIYSVKMCRYNRPLNEQMSFLLIPMFALTFSIAGAAVWEIFEFCCDTFFGLETQGVTPADTMVDIIAGTLGGIVAFVPILFWSMGKKEMIYNYVFNQTVKVKN